MPFFGENVLQGLGEAFITANGVKDYSHAAKTFLSNGYELTPRFKFLYHVYFNINVAQIPQLGPIYGSGEIATIGLMAKSVQLPQYQLQVEEMNQYNRKRLVQTKINYQPVQLVLQDDQGDLIRNMWYNYFSYYYKDPSQKYEGIPNQNGTLGNLATLQNGFGYNNNDIYAASRTEQDWGYIGESYSDGTGLNNTTGKPPFFRDIKIYGLSQKKFASYVLINPMITSWQHDTYDYSQGGGMMQNVMEIRYETVKYYSGAIGRQAPSATVSGFADPAHYDLTPSALSRPGATATVFGQGGLIDAAIGTIGDLQNLPNGGLWSVLGAAQKAGTAYNTFKGKDIRSIVNADARQAAVQVAQTSLPGYVRQAVNGANGMIFPQAPRTVFTPNNSPFRSG